MTFLQLRCQNKMYFKLQNKKNFFHNFLHYLLICVRSSKDIHGKHVCF